ncbi:MAG: Cna B-type domain-containing protein, partial [Ruminococcus sp.]|nr:Cna B-type domain-containing protein [Ruminococcus sp.]
MKKTLGKRIISGVTSLLLGLSAFSQAMPLSNGGVLKAKAVEENPDGLPTLTVPYENTIWYRGGPLGVAGDFHYFAFDTVTVGSHTNGNFAGKTVKGGVFYPNQYVGKLLNVVGENWEPGGDALLGNVPDFVVPADYQVYGIGDVELDYPTVRDTFVVKRADGTTFDVTRSSVLDNSYISHYSTNFMDFDALRTYYQNLSKSYGEKENSVASVELVEANANNNQGDAQNTTQSTTEITTESTTSATESDVSTDTNTQDSTESTTEPSTQPEDGMSDQNKVKDLVITLNPDGENVVNLTAEDLNKINGKIVIKDINAKKSTDSEAGAFNNGQYLIMNIDMSSFKNSDNSDTAGTVELGKWLSSNMKQFAIDDTNGMSASGELVFYQGTNILVNLVNAPAMNGGEPALTVNIGDGSFQTLAPDIHVVTKNTNGNVIAEDVTNGGGESHMNFFMNPMVQNPEEEIGESDITVKKEWSDGNDNHTDDDAVTVALYRSDEPNAQLSSLTDSSVLISLYKEAFDNMLAQGGKTALAKDETVINGYGSGMGPVMGPAQSLPAISVLALNDSGANVGEYDTNKNILNNTPYATDRQKYWTGLYPFEDYSFASVEAEIPFMSWVAEFKGYNELITLDEENGCIYFNNEIELQKTYNNTYWISLHVNKDPMGHQKDYSNGFKVTITEETDAEGNTIRKITKINGEPGEVAKIGSATLNKSNNWQNTWTNLPAQSATGVRYYYYAVEETVVDGYETSYS